VINSGDIRQLAILGAGFDVRAYRMKFPEGTKVFELDMPEHPGPQNEKRKVLASHGVDTSHVTFLPINFMKESVAEVLKAGGHDATKPTLFLWEGVTMYLTTEAITASVEAMKSVSAPGSFLMCELFDSYLMSGAGREDPLLAPYWKLVTSCGEPYIGEQIAPEAMAAFWTKTMDCRVVMHSRPDDQLAKWKAIPQSASIDDSGTPCHGGICHLFLLSIGADSTETGK